MAWLTGWTYRKAITIAHSDDGAQTNYQIKLLIGESSGATGEQFDLGGHCQTDFDDLRFTTSDGTTLCDYWIESITGTTPNQLATVWVEVPSIAAHPDNTTIYVYYGNAGASAVSSGANTFIDFDDFEASPGGTGWTDVNSSVDFDNTEQYWGGARSMKKIGDNSHFSEVTRAKTAGNGYAISYRERHSYSNYGVQIYHGNSSKGVCVWIGYTGDLIYYYDVSWKSSGSTTWEKDTWGKLEIRNIDFTAGTYDIVVNDSVVKTGTGMFTGGAYNDTVDFYGSGYTGRDIWIDNYIIRKFTANEPAFGSAGSEQTWQTVSPSNISSGESIGTQKVVSTQNLLPSGVISAEALGNSKLILFLMPSAIDSEEILGDAGLSATLTPSAILTAEVVGGLILGHFHIAGTVSLLGVGITGAVIRAVNQVTGEITETETDLNGNYVIALQAGNEHHISVEYESGGQKYNALSKWDVVPA